nr:ATP-binding cassette domain-containing protein [Oscillatoria sp. PCC 10802]
MTIGQNPLLRLARVSLSVPVRGSFSGGTPVLRDISFEVFEGERAAIVGPSGAGKTSLLRLLNRLSEPTGGAIYLENRDFRQIPIIELRRQIVLVMQESKLLGMPVREALAYPLKLRGVKTAEIERRVAMWVERLRIPSDWLWRTEVQLSAGQRQLVALARALVLEPKVLLLDEPTSALDAGRASELVRVLAQLDEGKATVLMANHQLDVAQQFCTRVLHLQAGELVGNLPVQDMDWAKLGESLIEAEAREVSEWS